MNKLEHIREELRIVCNGVLNVVMRLMVCAMKMYPLKKSAVRLSVATNGVVGKCGNLIAIEHICLERKAVQKCARLKG